MKSDFTVVEAARAVGIEAGRLRGWLQHRHIDFGNKSLTGRIRLSPRDVRVVALMARLIDHGLDPGHAAAQAVSVVDRIAAWNKAPLVAVFSRNPKVSPALIPEDSIPDIGAVILIPLHPLFERLGDV